MPRSISESARLSNYDIAVVDEKLRRALIRPADHWQQSSELLARDKTQGSAFRTGQHGPIRVLFLPHPACVLQHKDCARNHRLRAPFAQDVWFCNDLPSPGTKLLCYEVLLRL